MANFPDLNPQNKITTGPHAGRVVYRILKVRKHKTDTVDHYDRATGEIERHDVQDTRVGEKSYLIQFGEPNSHEGTAEWVSESVLKRDVPGIVYAFEDKRRSIDRAHAFAAYAIDGGGAESPDVPYIQNNSQTNSDFLSIWGGPSRDRYTCRS